MGAEATLHLTPVADPSAFGVVETDADGRVQRFLEKPAPGVTDSNLINAGTYVMEPTVLDSIPPGVAVNVERVTFPALAARGTLFGVATDDYWIDVGRPELLLQANLDRLAGRYDTTMDHPVSGGDGVDPDAIVAVDALRLGQRRRRRRRGRGAVGRDRGRCCSPGRGSAMMSSCRTPS